MRERRPESPGVTFWLTFRGVVRLKVPGEVAGIGETSAADVAGERPVREVVGTHVLDLVATVVEALTTQATLEGQFAGVCAHVFRHVPAVVESLAADIAGEGLFACVGAHVSGEAMGQVEVLAAIVAPVKEKR